MRRLIGIAPCVALGAGLAACSPTNRSDAAVDDVRNLRDGAVMLPSAFESSMPTDATMEAETPDVPMTDSGVPTDVPPADVADSGVVMDTGVDVPSPPPTTNVRFVHALPPGATGAPPAVDFCVRRNGTSDPFTGPLLRAARGGGGPGLSALQVSRYFAVTAGRIDVIAVGGMDADCSTPLLPPMTNLDVGAANGHRTVVVSGVPLPGPDGGAQPFPFAGRVIPDNAPNALAGMSMATQIRVFNAIPSPQRLDLGIVVGMAGLPTDLIPLFFNVGFGEVGRPPPMGDAGQGNYPNGYYQSTPIPSPGVTVGLRANCTVGPCGPMTAVPNIATDAMSITSVFLAIQLRGAMPTPIAIFCRDHLAPVSGVSQCAVLPP
ncbi:MAG: hypothetical protein JNK05_21685 [Myxococcales bacterium]|nr:hypothetical protein [Myxococcales bacterium]